jgi:uncharacterized protein (TIGR00299 family) protein
MSIVWVDASSGASGDMLLGALLDAGVPLDVIRGAVDAVAPEPVELVPGPVTRAGFAATRCEVRAADSAHRRTWSDIRKLLAGAALDAPVADLAGAVFTRLAEAEAAVHGTTPEDVHFHEVGALDAIADVVGVCAGFHHLGATEVVVSPVAVGSGTVRGAHGVLPVPPPAVAALLCGVPSYAGPAGAPATELCTPTGAALLTTLATSYGPQPAMVAAAVGVGAGGRDPEGHANVLRLFVGSTGEDATRVSGELVIEANVDDLDPRLWPGVLDALLSAGAVDAWLSPITMKKGRPAYTLHALVPPTAAAQVRRALFTETSTIGLREYAVAKRALARELVTVSVDGAEIAVKVARLAGRIVNAQPEWEAVARAASALGRPAHDVLAAAQAAAHDLRS